MDTKYLEIIKAPVITEKAGSLAQMKNQYVFKVDSRANKTEIKQAIEKIFKVKVEEIRTINVKPKKKKSWSLYWVDKSHEKSDCHFSRRSINRT